MSRTVALVAVLLFGAAAVVVLLTVPFPVLAGAHLHVDLARDFTPAQLSRERAYHAAIRPPAYAGTAVALLVSAGLGLTGAGARLVARLPGGWVRQVVLATVGLVVIGRLATLALDARVEVVLRRYGLSTQAWPGWLLDQVKGAGISAATTALALVLVMALARRTPRTWWAWGSLSVVSLTLVGSFVYPVLIQPAFNSFTSLPAGPLRTELLTLARRDRVSVTDVLVADASRRTTSLNAYVSGFGSTRRIVLYDTLVRSSSAREVRVLVAHELGHAKRQDVLHGTVIGALVGATGVCLLWLLLCWPWLLARAGARGAGDPAVVPLALFLVAAATFAFSPVTNLVTRHIEARADLHALELTGEVPTFIAGQQRLAVTNLSDLTPGPLVYAFFFDHPSGPERIAFARAWQRLHVR